MEDILLKYKDCGTFEFHDGNRIAEVSKNVPMKPGVYLIYGFRDGEQTLVYIGMSGTMKKNGEWGGQMLRKRLRMKQDKVYRQIYFTQKIKDDGWDFLRFHWYITYNNKHNHLPRYVEGLLIQRFYEQNSRLPEWNKDF